MLGRAILRPIVVLVLTGCGARDRQVAVRDAPPAAPTRAEITAAERPVGVSMRTATTPPRGRTPAAPVVATNEPHDFRMVSDQPWNGLTSLGWGIQWGDPNISRDETAPASPPRVLAFPYPPGFAGGSAPATATKAFAPTRGVFTRFWWKASDPWQGHRSNVNKLLFLFPESGGDITLVMYGVPGGPYELRAIPQYPGAPSEWLLPNMANIPVTLGVWHRVEWLVDDELGMGYGTVKWWMDGYLIGDHRGVVAPPGRMIELKISPTWGGVGDRKQELDHFWFDHIYVSRRP